LSFGERTCADRIVLHRKEEAERRTTNHRRARSNTGSDELPPSDLSIFVQEPGLGSLTSVRRVGWGDQKALKQLTAMALGRRNLEAGKRASRWVAFEAGSDSSIESLGGTGYRGT
jgi:hypothetical protein